MKSIRFLSVRFVVSAMVMALCLGLAPGVAFAAAGATARVSVSTVGAEGNAGCLSPYISAGGRYVVFDSTASNLVAGDTNAASDIFLRDRQTGVTERVSVGYQGQALGDSYTAAVSTDGRYVVFFSMAGNLVPGDTNGDADVFVRDRVLGVTTMVSVSSAEVQGTGGSWDPAISPDGRYVAFSSGSSQLVAGDTNGENDVFVRDRELGTTERVSVGVDGQGTGYSGGVPSISSDGRYVAFISEAANLTVADTNGFRDVFVRDRTLSITWRVSVDSSGVQGDALSDSASISADGRYVAYHSYSTNLVSGDTNGRGDAFLRDTWLGTTERVSVGAASAQGDNNSFSARVSADGRYVAFASEASNLVVGDSNGDADTFVRDRMGSTTTRVSLTSAGAEGNGFSWAPSMSSDGRYVAFASMASSLVPNDTNSQMDIFVNDWPVVATSATIRTTATSARIGSAPILSGSLAPAGLIGWNMVAYVKKPGRAYWTYSSNRTIYSIGGAAAWYYKYTFKRGMTKGVYYFRATVPALPGYATSNSSTIAIRLR